MLLNFLRSLTPGSWLSAYHYVLARLAAVLYGNPSRRMIVIGVTGTNGKTTTAYYLAKALEASGFPTGCTTTAILKIASKEWLNPTKMTMPGRFWLQRMFRRMLKAGCRYAVVETSSQGLIQHRHIGIKYDVAVFTNLTPEHIEAHGSFEKYKAAKRILFENAKTAIVNADDENGKFYADAMEPGSVRWFGLKPPSSPLEKGESYLVAEEVVIGSTGSTFCVENIPVCLNQPGIFNVRNALAALATAKALGVSIKNAAAKLSAIRRVPGRFERVEAGQSWTVIVDYAPEPESFRQFHQALSTIPRKKTIQVIGSCGGGRDAARRPILGKLAAERADIVIVTNEDPYDDDPKLIIDQVAAGAEAAGKKPGVNLFTIIDRKQAIIKAMQLAEPGDLVALTGKGCEPWICAANGKKLPWDEIQAAKDAIAYVSRR